MSVWLCLPSKRPPEEAEKVLLKWRERGYKIALWRDESDDRIVADWEMRGWEYPGYARAVNVLAQQVLEAHPGCDWIVAAGDDTYPDPNKTADEIARECSEHFYDDDIGRRIKIGDQGPVLLYPEQARTFGVMQPTGDPWSDPRGKLIERIAGSPWLGREWCRRANGGRGPLWPGFFHMWADETLQLTAQRLGVFWQRPDLTHHHDHWGRPRPGERFADHNRMPAFLARANSTAQTDADRAEFERLRRGDFRECYPS